MNGISGKSENYKGRQKKLPDCLIETGNGVGLVSRHRPPSAKYIGKMVAHPDDNQMNKYGYSIAPKRVEEDE